MIRLGDALDILSRTNVQIVVMIPKIFILKISGHPTDCINGAHRIFNSHFTRPWEIIKIDTKSPKDRDLPRHSDWLFDIVAKAT